MPISTEINVLFAMRAHVARLPEQTIVHALDLPGSAGGPSRARSASAVRFAPG